MKKPILAIIFIAFIFLVYGVVEAPQSFTTKFEALKNSKEIDLVFVGDVMLSRQIEVIARREDDFRYHFLKVADLLREADITFGNLESPVSTRGRNVGSIYSFRASPQMLEGVTFSGFDVLSVANNHAFDWGEEAFLDTVDNLRGVGILPVGGGRNLVEARVPQVLVRDGNRVAFLAYSEFVFNRGFDERPTIAPIDLEMIKEDVLKARAVADFVVVSFHWGNEYETFASEKQRATARATIQAGASLVVGHHPHVIQEVEEYDGGLIAYSLGNFIFDQNFSEDTRKGMLLKVKIKNGKILNFEPIEVKFSDKFQTYIP